MGNFYLILEILLAYLIGSIPSAVWIGKLFYNTDVRQYGSGNAGATNVIRVLGYKAGIPVLLFDVLKGWAAVHVFPVFAGFKGGKGVGTLAGVAIALYPVALLIVFILFICILTLTRYVSLASILCGILFPFIVIFITEQKHPGLIILSVIIAIFIPLTHSKNIKRLMRGTENKFEFLRKKKEDGA
jgi:glycerol-3-phosphate acyltransferase PlsY